MLQIHDRKQGYSPLTTLWKFESLRLRRESLKAVPRLPSAFPAIFRRLDQHHESLSVCFAV
jgi:hypothetical protein